MHALDTAYRSHHKDETNSMKGYILRKRGTFLVVMLLSSLSVVTNTVLAQDLAMVDMQGNRASSDILGVDGKFNLVMIRKDDCSACEKAELELDPWYDQQDKDKVSALILNIDDASAHDAVKARLDENSIDIPSFITLDYDKTLAGFKELTQQDLSDLPLPVWLIFLGDIYFGLEAGADFDQEITDEMIMAMDSGLPGLTD